MCLAINDLPAKPAFDGPLAVSLSDKQRLYAIADVAPTKCSLHEGECEHCHDHHRRRHRPPRPPRRLVGLIFPLERPRFADHAAALLARGEVCADRLELFAIEVAVHKGCKYFGVAVACHRVGHRETSSRAATEPSSFVDGRKTGVPREKSRSAPSRPTSSAASRGSMSARLSSAC